MANLKDGTMENLCQNSDPRTFYNGTISEGLEKRNESEILYMRNFNNWIKSKLIDEYLSRVKAENRDRQYELHVLDLGCGKGGDFKKWDFGRVKHVTFADIAENSIEICKQRYSERRGGRYGADFFALDCTEQLIRDQIQSEEHNFDLVSSQFVLHYSFKDYQSANTFLRNASELLRVGGYFIGTTVNSCRVVQLCRDSTDQTISNNYFKISFEDSIDLKNTDDNSIPLFGAKYHFTLADNVDCPEYLVYFPLLVSLAEKHGLKLVRRSSFKEYFNEGLGKNEINLLNRMKALERFPPIPNRNQRKADGAHDPYTYQHAIDYLGENRDANQSSKNSCRTLSKEEWDIASLYIVFAFKKVQQVSYNDSE